MTESFWIQSLNFIVEEPIIKEVHGFEGFLPTLYLHYSKIKLESCSNYPHNSKWEEKQSLKATKSGHIFKQQQ